MSPETDAALRTFLEALTALAKLATEAIKRDLRDLDGK